MGFVLFTPLLPSLCWKRRLPLASSELLLVLQASSTCHSFPHHILALLPPLPDKINRFSRCVSIALCPRASSRVLRSGMVIDVCAFSGLTMSCSGSRNEVLALCLQDLLQCSVAEIMQQKAVPGPAGCAWAPPDGTQIASLAAQGIWRERRYPKGRGRSNSYDTGTVPRT